MVLSDAVISSRRTAYACCAGEFSVKMRKAHQTGNTASYERNRKMMVHALWAADVMNRTALSTETFTNQCVSHDDAANSNGHISTDCHRNGCSLSHRH